jgi:hypothetical protein
MQGIYVNGQRPKSKRAIKEALAADPRNVLIEATSVFGNEWQGRAADMPEGMRVNFVGPCPHTSRKFYGTISKAGGRLRVA